MRDDLQRKMDVKNKQKFPHFTGIHQTVTRLGSPSTQKEDISVTDLYIIRLTQAYSPRLYFKALGYE